MRDRSWRRAQRERVRRNRYEQAKVLWSWSYERNREWFDETARKWGKVNPFTACSCWMCTYDIAKRFAPDPQEWD